MTTGMIASSAQGHFGAGASGVGPWIYDRWVSKPAQNRSERTFFRFLDAAEGLLAVRHWHEVSVQEIVRRAEASVGSFYNRFADKEALLGCLDDRLGQECRRTVAGLVEEFENTPVLVEAGPGIMISLFIRLCHDRKGVIRALDLAQKMAPGNTGGGLIPGFDAAIGTMSGFLATHHGALRQHQAADITQAFRECFYLAREAILYGRERGKQGDLHASLLRHFEASLTPA